jgi:O-antigen ligase
VVGARTSLNGSGTQTHFQFYQLVPPALDPHPLFGMGFNTFAVFYQFITGRSDYGPHSAWIAILVETGTVGLAVYLAYFGYLLACAAAVRRSPAPDDARIGHGLLAALAATAAANLFYLTMIFDYFFALALLAVAGAAMFAVPARAAVRARAPAVRPAR